MSQAMGSEAGQLVAALVNGSAADLNLPLSEINGAEGEELRLEPVTLDSSQGLQILRHSASHVMAQAVKQIYPETKLAIGPAIEDGFYYDFDRPQSFTPEDLERIEQRMHQIVEQDLPFQKEALSKGQARDLFGRREERYKLELIEDIADAQVNVYRQGDFEDLCQGPHIPSTGKLKAFKLLSLAGAYWRGDERNPMLQRIYGTAFASQGELDGYLYRIEEAKRRDHRKLGRELELFLIEEEAGAGLVIYQPKGAMLRKLLEDFERREHLKRGYQIIYGPQLLKLDLWQKSGHYDNYRENMYFTEIEGQMYGIKPMNCLAHMLVYRSKVRSYRELPLRYFELGTVYRHEKTGVLHGLTRVRGFTQDDAHIICTPEQLNAEITGVIDFVKEVMGLFGFEYHIEVSTRPEKSIGSDEDWNRATQALYNALNTRELPYTINEGDGAFYGPKIDQGCAGAVLAVRHYPVRLHPAGALRVELYRRGRPAAPPGYAAPRYPRLAGALYGGAD